MNKIKIYIISFVCIVAALILPFFFGGYTLLYMKIMGPANENVQRQIFENTQSFVRGKRQDATRYYHQYMSTQDQQTRNAIKNIIQMDFVDFDEQKYINNVEIRQWLHNMKYN